MATDCKQHHMVWTLTRAEAGLFGDVVHIEVACAHCDQVRKRTPVGDEVLARQQCAASQESHARLCRNRAMVPPTRWTASRPPARRR